MWLRIALLCLASAVCRADELQLHNGDRITGEILSRSGDRLVVRTDYAGEVSVRLDDVRVVLLRDAFGELHEIGPPGLAEFDPGAYRSPAGVVYAGRALVSVAYTRGNTESDQVHLDGDFTARARTYRYNLSARVDRRSEPLVDPTTAWLGSANFDRFFSEKRFAYVRASVEHDRTKDIDVRTALGVGYGLQLLETPAANVSVRAGLDHVRVERFIGPREEYPAFGWGVKAQLSPFGPHLQLFHEQEGFWNLEESDVVVVRSKTGMRVPLVERLNATAQLNVDWERRPAAGRRSTDATLLLGVDYAF